MSEGQVPDNLSAKDPYFNQEADPHRVVRGSDLDKSVVRSWHELRRNAGEALKSGRIWFKNLTTPEEKPENEQVVENEPVLEIKETPKLEPKNAIRPGDRVIIHLRSRSSSQTGATNPDDASLETIKNGIRMNSLDEELVGVVVSSIDDNGKEGFLAVNYKNLDEEKNTIDAKVLDPKKISVVKNSNKRTVMYFENNKPVGRAVYAGKIEIGALKRYEEPQVVTPVNEPLEKAA